MAKSIKIITHRLNKSIKEIKKSWGNSREFLRIGFDSVLALSSDVNIRMVMSKAPKLRIIRSENTAIDKSLSLHHYTMRYSKR